MVILLLTMASCSKPQIDLGDYGDTPITISRNGEETTVTPNELAKLELYSKSASGGSAKAGTVKATGPTLKTFLAHLNIEPESVKLVRFIAKDAYRVTLHTKTILESQVILSLAPLSESEQPMRLLIPDLESNQWVYGVIRIEIELLPDSDT